MNSPARRLLPLAVLLAGLVAAAAAVALVAHARRVERAQTDRNTALLISAAVDARIDALFRSVRGPAQAFDLASLEAREVSGVLRLAYTQSGDVTAVTLVDERGAAVVPAVFLSRGAVASTGGRAIESFDDLDRFAREIPFEVARTRGRAVRGPYPSLRGDGARFAMAQAIPVSEGARTWVLAAEIDAAHVLDGLGRPVSDAAVAIVTDRAVVGATLGDDARRAVVEALRARRVEREPIALAGSGWHAVVSASPAGLEGALAVVWSGDDSAARRARVNDLALGIVIVTIVGALAMGVFVALRDSTGLRAGLDTPSMRMEARVLGAVVKELANPVAATVAAAQLLAAEPGHSRVTETLQRSTQRVQRAFRRVSRLARAGEEVVRARVDLAAITRREVDALRGESAPGASRVAYDGPADGVAVRADEDDIAVLVQSLLDAARALAAGDSEVRVEVRLREDGSELRVSDTGAVTAAVRKDATALERSSHSATATPALALTVAARIAADHSARFEIVDRTDGPGCHASVTFGGAAAAASG